MSDFLSYFKKALEHAEKSGLTKDAKFVITGVFLDENGHPDNLFMTSNGNEIEKYGMATFLGKYIKNKSASFTDEVIYEPDSSSESEKSIKTSSLTNDDRDDLTKLTKKLLDKNITPEEREELTAKIKTIMKKAVKNHMDKKENSSSSDKLSPENEKKIKDFMERFGKNLRQGDDFDEKDLINSL